MFQTVHAHVASKVLGTIGRTIDPYAIIGAILPDASISSLLTYFAAFNPASQASLSTRITFYDMHPLANARALVEGMKNKHVALGILTHSITDVVSHGGDDVSHKHYDWRHPTAYSFGGERGWWGRKFPRLQVKSYSGGMFLHNVAEGMLDRYVAQTYPEDVKLLLAAIKHVDVRGLSEDLAQALGKNPQAIEERIRAYLHSTTGFVRLVQRLPRVNPTGMEDVLEACVQKCKEEIAKSKDI